MTHYFCQTPHLTLPLKVGSELRKLQFHSGVYSTDDKDEIKAIESSKLFRAPRTIYKIPAGVDPKSPDLLFEIPEIEHSAYQKLLHYAKKLGNIPFVEQLSESDLKNAVAKREGELRKLLIPEVVERPKFSEYAAPVEAAIPPSEITKPKRKKS